MSHGYSLRELRTTPGDPRVTPSMTARDPADLLTIIAAEGVFDAGPDLRRRHSGG
jgi:hypothetical protein